jgi:hypothetical protein
MRPATLAPSHTAPISSSGAAGSETGPSVSDSIPE